MRIQKIIDVIEEWAPPVYAEDFDNVGLIIGDAYRDCKGVLVTHDTLENVVDECISKNLNLIVSFHPIIFSGLKKLTQSTYCLLYTSPSPRDRSLSRMPSSA